MFTKTAALVRQRVSYNFTCRLVHNLASDANLSYLHNPGSEPLTIATLGDVLAETAHKYPGREAIRSVYEDVSITYEELLTQADSLGCALRANGFEKGDRLGLWCHNSAAWIVTLVAAARAGLISVLINPVYDKAELSFCIKKTGLKGLLIGNALQNRDYIKNLRYLIPEIDSAKPGSLRSDQYPDLTTLISIEKEKVNGTLQFDSLTKNKSNTEISKYGSEIKPEDGSIIHFTSGTTGDPKAALDSNLGVVNNTYFIGKRNLFDQGHQRICIQVPLFHALGSVVTVLAGFRHGATLVVAGPTYHIPTNINAILAEKCTAVTGTPTMYVDMISQIQSKGDLPMQLQMALAAGAPCSPQLIRNIQKYMKAKSVLALYGMSETTASVFQSVPGDSIDTVAESVGYIQDHVEVKVIDEDGKTVPFGSPGELVTRGYNNMICYWDEPEKTKGILDEEGWLSTGDKFTISPDGYGRVVGRLKDIIVRGGENIAPKEIEDLLNTHPDIIESQVVGVADERLGEELCAVLRIREGASVTASDVSKHCTGHLAKFKIPRMLKVTDEFPKTASGKIQKFKLKELIESGKLEAACLISGSLHWDLEAEVLADVYRKRALRRQRGEEPLPEEIVRWRSEGCDDLFQRWEERLADASVSLWLVEAIRPVLRQWVEAKHREPTYFLTQLLTGHGCFGRYLWKVVGIESGPGCHHCASGAEDTAEHTLAVCTGWDAQRASLVRVVGRDLSLPAVIESMAGSEQSWAAVASFANEVMAAKRAALRERERAGDTLAPRRAPVIDEDGKTVPFGSPGELVTRGYNNMICYWDEPEKTKGILDEEGWLSTGDKFTISPDGYGRVVGRLKDIIVRGGENIAPKEIEDLLNTHPDIIESQVVGVADERLGEELCAVLRIRDGASVTASDVSKHCTGHLAKFKIPRMLKVTDEFPKTASGKIQKFKLKELIESGKL